MRAMVIAVCVLLLAIAAVDDRGDPAVEADCWAPLWVERPPFAQQAVRWGQRLDGVRARPSGSALT
jgi:hypothetical protein